MSQNALRKIIKQNPQHVKNAAARNDIVNIMNKSAALAGLNCLGTSVEAQSKKDVNVTTPARFVDDLWLPALHIILANKSGLLGLLSLDLDLINAIGDVLTGELCEEPQDNIAKRDPTSTDAALCRPFVDALLNEFATMLQKMNGAASFSPFTTTDTDPDPSPHSFPEIPYLSVTMALDIAEGARKGQMRITLPSHSVAVGNDGISQPLLDPVWRQNLNESVLSSTASFSAILHRINMPIGNVMKLKVGDLLEFPNSVLDELVLETGSGTHARRHLTARLGEYQEMRAAKIIFIDS